MKATYICTTNDVLANVGVITAGGLVAWTGSTIPDLVIGTTIEAAVFRGALRILKPLAFVRQPSAPEVGPLIAGWARWQTDLGCLDAVSIGVSTLRVRRCPSVTLLTRQVLVSTRW
jgi:hypothetical protein